MPRTGQAIWNHHVSGTETNTKDRSGYMESPWSGSETNTKDRSGYVESPWIETDTNTKYRSGHVLVRLWNHRGQQLIQTPRTGQAGIQEHKNKFVPSCHWLAKPLWKSKQLQEIDLT